MKQNVALSFWTILRINEAVRLKVIHTETGHLKINLPSLIVLNYDFKMITVGHNGPEETTQTVQDIG